MQEECKSLTTFFTLLGIFLSECCPRANMLPKMREVLKGLKVCDVIMDDTIVYDCTMEEHDRRLNYQNRNIWGM